MHCTCCAEFFYFHFGVFICIHLRRLNGVCILTSWFSFMWLVLATNNCTDLFRMHSTLWLIMVPLCLLTCIFMVMWMYY